MNIFTVFISVNVNAQTNYELDINEDDSFIWEVKELNIHNFEKVFGFEPAFELGDKSRRVIREIDTAGYGWYVTIEFWDFKDDFEKDGEIVYEKAYDNPIEYEDNIFIPTPVNNYLEDTELPSKYEVSGSIVTQRELDYTIKREYDTRGVLVLEEYTDDDGIVMVRVEGTFRVIPMGNYFIGYIVLAVMAIIFVMIKKRKFIVKKA